MNDSDQLREQMWDLVYGLLSPEECTALIARIKSDPPAARLYAEVRLQADLVGSAARVEDSSLVFKAEPALAERPAPVGRGRQPAAIDTRTASRAGGPRGTTWLVAIAATALALLLAVGYLWPQPDVRQIAANYIVTDVECPSSVPAGLTSRVALHTHSLDGEAHSATVDLLLQGQAGRQLFRRQVTTSDVGRATVEIPGAALEPGVRLEVMNVAVDRPPPSDAQQSPPSTDAGEQDEKNLPLLAADLPVREEPQMAYFLLEEPTVTRGKPIKFSIWGFKAFSANPTPAEITRYAVESLDGAALVEPIWTPDAERGVVNGVVQVPASAAADALAFRAQADSVSAAPLGRTASDERSERLSRSQAVAESVKPAAPAGALADLLPRQATDLPAAESARRASQPVLQDRRVELLKETAPLESASPSGRGEASALTQNQLPVIAAGQPISIEVPSELAGKQLVATAVCRGVTVATEQLSAEKKPATTATKREADEPAAETFALHLPSEADGLIEVALFDPASNSQQPVHRQFIYRQPARALQIELPALQERFTPGEQVQLVLQVRDESGQPAANTQLGVRVWNEQLVQQSGQQPVLLADAVREGIVGAMVEQAQPDEPLAAKLSELTRANTAGLEANRPQANNREVEELAQPPVDKESFGLVTSFAPQEKILLATNRPAVQAQYDAAVAFALSERYAIMTAIGSAAMFGGIVLLVLLGMLALLRLANKVRVAVPALLVAVASLVIGLNWVGWLPQANWQQIAMAPRAVPTQKPASPAQDIATAAAVADNISATSPAPEGAVAAAGTRAADTLSEAPLATASEPAAPPPSTPLVLSPRPAELQTDLQSERNAKVAAEGSPASAGPLAVGGAAPAAASSLPLGNKQEGQSTAGASVRLQSGDQAQFRFQDQQDGANLTRAKRDAPQSLAERRLGALSAPQQAAPALPPLASPAPRVIAGGLAPARKTPAAKTLELSEEAKDKEAAAARGGAKAGDGGGISAARGATPQFARNLRKADDAAAEKEAVDRPRSLADADANVPATQAPAALYFNPQLVTDVQGRATIEFVMPPVDCEYRLLIDAIGNGRIGSRQLLLECKSATAK